MLSQYHQIRLYQYFSQNNIEKLTKLFTKGLDVNFITREKECLLSYALMANSIEGLKLLIEKKVSVPDYGTKVKNHHIPYLKLYIKHDNQAPLLDILLTHYSLNLIVENTCYEFDDRFENEEMQKMNTTFLGRLLFNSNTELMKVVVRHLNQEQKEQIYEPLIYLAEHYFDFKMNNNQKTFIHFTDTINVILEDVITNQVKTHFKPSHEKFLNHEHLSQRLENILLMQSVQSNDSLSVKNTKKLKI